MTKPIDTTSAPISRDIREGKLMRRAIKQRPHLVIHNKKCLSLEFVFEKSVTGALKQEYPKLYRFLHAARKEDKSAWKKILQKAYKKRPSGSGKTSQRGLHQYLHRLLKQAILVLIEQAEGTERICPGIKKEIQSIGEVANEKRKRPKSTRRQEKMANSLSRRFETLKPQVVELKKFIKSLGSQDDRTIIEKIEKSFKHSWLACVTRGAALKNLPTSTSSPRPWSSPSGDWQSWQLTTAVLHEQENLEPRLSPNTIYKYVCAGRNSLKLKNAVKRTGAFKKFTRLGTDSADVQHR